MIKQPAHRINMDKEEKANVVIFYKAACSQNKIGKRGKDKCRLFIDTAAYSYCRINMDKEEKAKVVIFIGRAACTE